MRSISSPLAELGGRAHQVQIGPCRPIGGLMGCLDHSPDPVFVDAGVAAVTGQQRDRHAGDARQQNLVDRLLQHVQARHAHDRVDITADDDLEDDRRTLGDEHAVTHLLGEATKISNAARSARFAIEAELVVFGGATFRMFEAMRHQKQTPVRRHGRDLFFPERRRDDHHHPTEERLGQFKFA